MVKLKSLGRYEILGELGRGGMGIVMKGKDPRIDRLVAHKIIKFAELPNSERDKELLERFYYRMTSVNSGGAESELTSPVSGVTFGSHPAPTSIKAASGLVKQVVVSCKPLIDGEVAGYNIYQRETADSLKVVKKIRDRRTTQFKDAGPWNQRLKDGTAYYYTVKSVNTVDVESLTQYVIYSAGIFGKQKIAKTKGSSYIVEKLKPGTSYSYLIVALDKENLMSEPSAPAQVKTLK